jgi:hypothetical protein
VSDERVGVEWEVVEGDEVWLVCCGRGELVAFCERVGGGFGELAGRFIGGFTGGFIVEFTGGFKCSVYCW